MKSVEHHYMDLVTFSRKEAVSVLLLAFVAALGLTFRQWGGAEYDPITGVFNLMAVFIGMLFVVLMHEFGHKIVAAWRGCTVEIKTWGTGLIGSVVVQFLSAGFIPLFTPNTFEFDARPDIRIHKAKKYSQLTDEAIIAGGGLLGTSVAIAVFHTLYTIFNHEVLAFITLGAILHGVFSMLPFEILHFLSMRKRVKDQKFGLQDGSHLIWASQGKHGSLWMYFLAWAYLAFFAILIVIVPPSFFSLFFVLLGAFGTTFVYYHRAT